MGKKFIWMLTVVLVVILLFPPWIDDDGPVGYGFIGSPPDHAERIDFGRLFLQCLALGIICVACVLSLKSVSSAKLIIFFENVKAVWFVILIAILIVVILFQIFD